MNDIKKALYANTMIHIADNDELEIEACRQIIEYNDIYIRVKTSTLFVEVWGSGLTVDDFGNNTISIYGKISSVGLEPLTGGEKNA